MKRTTIYLEADLELRLKRETRRQKRSMAGRAWRLEALVSALTGRGQ